MFLKEKKKECNILYAEENVIRVFGLSRDAGFEKCSVNDGTSDGCHGNKESWTDSSFSHAPFTRDPLRTVSEIAF